MVDEGRARRRRRRAVDPDEVLAFARALIAAPSENPGGTEDEAAAVAGDILTGLGAEPEIVRSDAGRPSVVAHDRRRGAADASPGTATSTSCPPARSTPGRHDPWAGEVDDDGRLVGRGAADMKGPIAAALAAAAALRRAGIELAGHARVPPGRRRGARRHPRHQGAVGTRAARPGRRASWASRASCRSGLAERGGAWFTATAYGTAAHGSQPHRGVNAITSMARFLLRLPEVLPDLEHPLVGPAHRERRPDLGRQRPQRRARPVRGRHRPAHRARRDRPRRGAGAVPRAGRRRSARSIPRSRSRSSSASGPTPPRRRPTSTIARIAGARPSRRCDRAPRRRRGLHRHHRRALLHQRGARSPR